MQLEEQNGELELLRAEVEELRQHKPEQLEEVAGDDSIMGLFTSSE